MRPNTLMALVAVSALGGFVTSAPAWAQATPRSFAASPDVYKVIAENEQYRVIAANWKPGQRDNWHSHGAPVAVYFLTDCTARIHTPDGKFNDVNPKASGASVRAQAPSHSFENVGKADCRMILFEPK